MDSFLLCATFLFHLWLKVSCNAEGDALNALKNNLNDPNNILQNWDPTQANPCSWFRVTCNNDNRVVRIDLGDEDLSGQLVPQLGRLLNLQYLELHSNNISGKIPDELGNLTNLVSLDLYLNRLTGAIPDLGNLKKLHFLRLNNNSLSGNIPMSLTTVASLQVLFQNNPGLKQRKFSAAPSVSPPPPPARSGKKAAAAIAGSALAFTAPAIVFALAYWRRRKPEDYYFDVPAEPEVNFWELYRSQIQRFSIYELQAATDNFNNRNILGRGGFGSVYKGRLADGTLVAVKRMSKERYLELQFQTELEMIRLAVHRNLRRLLGFCMTPTERLLVYPFMVNGSVSSHLRERPESQPPLHWPIRKRIALGAARGLAYLHEHCDLKIIHRDVKASNILLDEEFEAVLGDFGLVKLMNYQDTHVTTAVRGTIGHIAPEYLSTGKASDKSDVFGYGVMLLELISGQRAFDLSRLANDEDCLLLEWLKGLVRDKRLEIVVDADILGRYKANQEEFEQLILVALLCTQDNPLDRPKMSEVVRMLEDFDDLPEKWEQWQKQEMLHQLLINTTHHVDATANPNWIQESDISEDELSGPR